MNSIVSLPIAAAVPIPSPSFAVNLDVKAKVARLEQAIELLRTRHVCDGWKLDEVGAERALRYFRAGCPEDQENEWGATLMFIGSHGLSLDWICDGDAGSMICSLASQSPRAKDLPDPTDPIFDAIEAHKAAHATWIKWVNIHSDLEQELPKNKRQSNIAVWEEKIVETDDPRWIEAERELMRTSDAEADAACTLLDAKPTTKAGLLALLNHAISYDTDGMGWPSQLESGDERNFTRSWHFFLIETVAASIADLTT